MFIRVQFAINYHGISSRAAFVDFVRRADSLGVDVLAAPDHLVVPAPFTTLAVAATISDRLRLRTYVLNVGFWNAALLAREAATLDVLSDGRLELGLGAGHMRAEHEDAQLPWPPFAQRTSAVESLAVEVRRRLNDDGHRPQPVQRPVPLVIGSMSSAGLELAAKYADIVAFAGLRQIRGAPPGSFTVASAAETAERVAEVRRLAGGRPYRSDVLLQAVELDRDPGGRADRFAADAPGVTAAELLDSPFVLFARDEDEAARELRRREELYGFDGVTTHEPYLEALGEVIAAYRARDAADSSR